MFLWALTALSIPIIIHLFNFRKTTRIYFSTIKFLKQVQQETSQKRKLKQYLVLASRLLFLFFLVLAFAQPFLPATEQTASQRTIQIYLDNSYSMSVPVEEKIRALDVGISYINELVKLFPPETRYKLLTNDFAPFSNSYKTGGEITDLLAQVRLSPVSRSFQDITKRMDDSGTLFWISDFQKSTFGPEPELDSTLQVRLIPISSGQLSNVFVDSIYLENPYVIGGEKNTLKLRLRNNGNRTLEGLVTRLSINGNQAATASITLQPNSSAETSFDLAGNLHGYNEAELSFSDFPVSFDNQFFFALNYSGKLRIIEIKPESKSTYIEKVFGNKELFDFRSFAASNIDYGILEQADLVIVNGLNRIDPSLNSALIDYKSNYGSLLFISGLQPDIDSYKRLLGINQLNKVEKLELAELDRPDFQNPLFENVFEDQAVALSMPRAIKLLDWGADRTAILRFKNGQPFLSRYGNMFVMATSLSNESTDFYNNALFVPVMYRIAATGKKIERKPYYYLNTTLVKIPTDSLFGEEPAKLIGAGEMIPTQRKLRDHLLIEIPRFSVSPGFYKVLHKNDTLDVVAFNLDKRESILNQFSGEEVKTALGGGKQISIFEATDIQTFSNEIKERYLGTPLWKYALILALIFLLAEVLLIRFLK